MEKQEIEFRHNEVKKNANKKLVRSKFLYFNIMLHKFLWEIDYNCPEGALAYVLFKNKDINELDDGTIHISPRVFENEKFNSANYLFILIHELLHIVFQHGSRQKHRDQTVWNVAADHYINSLIRQTFSEDEVYPPFGYDQIICFEHISINGKTTEEIYDILMQDIDRFAVEGKQSNGNGTTTYTIKDNKTGKSYEVTVSDHEKDKIESFGRTAAETYKALKDRGTLPGSFSEVFKKFFKVELPWDEILKIAIKKSITPQPNTRGWRTLNKLFYPHGYTLPGIAYSDEEKVDIGVVSIDTSGSISSSELQMFYNILIDSMTYFKKLIIISHDSEIHQLEEFHEPEKLRSFLERIGLKGRGGTSHKDVFDRIREIQKKEITKISIYIGLTDGYSDIEDNWRNLKVPTYFLITRNGIIPKICNNNNPRSIQISKDY